MPESISQVAVSPEMFGKVEDSYSADRISEGIAVRKPAIFEGKLYLATGINTEEVKAYQLVPAEEFTGEMRTYNVPKGREYEEYYESLRKDPNGFYHGMLVKRGAHEHALVGPPIIFVVKARTKKLQPQPQLRLLGGHFDLLPNALIVQGKPSIGEYDEAFHRLSLIESAQSWWWGDLANGRERHYGSLEQMAGDLDINYNTLAQYQSVSRAYELCDRSQSLSWKHHLIAAPLDDRLDWLKRAEEKGWSTRTLELEIHKAKRAQLPLPKGIYDVIYADPPWRYSNVLPQWGSAELHYPTMSIDELCSLQIPAGNDAALFLWVTNPFLRDAFQVIDAWGFEYKTNIVWVKTNLKKPGSGFWLRGRHELLYICGRGSFVPNQVGKEPIGSVISENSALAADVQEHSKKPDVVYEIIEGMYPEGKYLELFARQRRAGWESWGNELYRP